MAHSQMAESIRSSLRQLLLDRFLHRTELQNRHLGLETSELATVHGDQNQQCPKHKRPTRLCDRLIFGRLNGDFICAAELKGGRNPEVPKAISQIQGGLELARTILRNRTIEKWYPLLFFRGKMRGNDLRAIQTRTVSYGGKRKLIDRIDCGSSLLAYLNRQ